MTEVIQSARLIAGANLHVLGASWKQNTVPVRGANDRHLPGFTWGLPRVSS